jgi:hypothetical protein
MIHNVTQRPDGFYECGNIDDNSITLWACYYDDSVQNIVVEYQITTTPINYAEGPLMDGWIGIYSDDSAEELKTELENRGKTLI